MHAAGGLSARSHVGLIVLVGCLGPALSQIATDELKFISQWTNLSVGTLQTFQNSTSKLGFVVLIPDGGILSNALQISDGLLPSML